ncbi:MAG: hypothetical protein R2873_13145 [Caldilineaceae bacterium]
MSMVLARTVCASFRTQLTQDGYGNRYFQLGEFQVLRNSQPVVVTQAVASSSLPGWSADRLVDNNLTTQWSSYGHTEHLSSSEWAAVLLQQHRHPTDRLYPRYNAAQQADGFPKTSCCSTRTTATAANTS